MERSLSYSRAILEAICEEMDRDPSVIMLGEGVHTIGELVERFGLERIRTTPISENGFGGAAIGAAIAGLRPIVEFRNAAFLLAGMDQLVSNAAKLRYMSGGQFSIPVVFLINYSCGFRRAAQHSFNPSSWLMNCPGLKVVAPSTPNDAKGLVKSAIRDDDPVVVMRHQRLLSLEGPVPQEDYTIPLGQAEVRRRGRHLTIVATLYAVHMALEAAERLAQQGIEVEVIDARSLVPLDSRTILASVKETGRLLVVDEGHKRAGLASEIAALVAEEAFPYLRAPIRRLCCEDVPFPYSPPLEDHILPSVEKIVVECRGLMKSP